MMFLPSFFKKLLVKLFMVVSLCIFLQCCLYVPVSLINKALQDNISWGTETDVVKLVKFDENLRESDEKAGEISHQRVARSDSMFNTDSPCNLLEFKCELDCCHSKMTEKWACFVTEMKVDVSKITVR